MIDAYRTGFRPDATVSGEETRRCSETYQRYRISCHTAETVLNWPEGRTWKVIQYNMQNELA